MNLTVLRSPMSEEAAGVVYEVWGESG
jgi:hypothetical protein